MLIKKTVVMLMINFISLFSNAQMNINKNDSAVIDACIEWIKQVDDGEYELSWQQAAPYFQEKITASEWRYAATKARLELGELSKRNFSSVHLHSSFPEAPDGEYVVVSADSRYQHNHSTKEFFTLMKVASEWKVIGYFIR